MVETFKIFNPFDHSLVEEVSYNIKKSVLQDLQQMEECRKANDVRPFFERASLLKKVSELIARDRDKLAKLITEEMGKPITDSRIEVDRAELTFRIAAEEATRINGTALHSDALTPARGMHGLINFFPLGIILCITPFNFPVNLAAHKIAPGLAAGNRLLLKPHPQTYRSSKHLIDLCYEAGFTQFDLKLVFLDTIDLPDLIAHPFIRAINFTGGHATAQAICKVAGVKKMLFELGGNDVLVVMDDGDVEKAVEASILHRFRLAGQRCNACKKIYIHHRLYEPFKVRLLEKTYKLNIGNPLDEKTDVGPLVSLQATEQVKKRLDEALSDGAKVVYGGTHQQNLFMPTILENVSVTSRLIQEETFGPILPLFSFHELEDLLEHLRLSFNGGLQAGIFTQNIQIAKKFYDKLDVGTINLNEGPGFRLEHFPFGGVGEAGIGREGIYYAIREMSYLKSLVF